MEFAELLTWLKETDPSKLKCLFKEADSVRKRHVGDEVHLRGLIEYSNICHRNCTYCGIRIDNKSVIRYRMTQNEVVEAVQKALKLGYGTITLQSGESGDHDIEYLKRIVEYIKSNTSCAITLSVGEMKTSYLRQLRVLGADRFLLRFETSNRTLFDKIHPPAEPFKTDRIEQLKTLHEIGFEVGSGVMVGIPGQKYEDLVNDILLFEKLDLDMMGIGPYIPHPGTPLGQEFLNGATGENEVPNSMIMTLKMVALTRLHLPGTNLPSTTALETVSTDSGYEEGLNCGANVLMPNLTPYEYRKKYEIYPNKSCSFEHVEVLHDRIITSLEQMGRIPGFGRGDSPNYQDRTTVHKSGKDLSL